MRVNFVTGEYRLQSALCTDFYQLTMAYAYFREGIAEEEACFHIFFRKHPFKGGFTIAAGLESAAKYLLGYRFSTDELKYLRSLCDKNNNPYFSADFIDYLANLNLRIDVDAAPEGTPLFPYEPIMRIRGPLLQCQLLETPLLNIINFQSLIATKAARLCLAAQGSAVTDFGLRRAQGFDGALSASRASYIGGCASTSNVLAGFNFHIPLSGTMAHSFIMRFAHEEEAFSSFTKAMPSNSVLLVDTYSSAAGLNNALKVGQNLRKQGHDLAGIRLDSGDLLALSMLARKRLDEAGFFKTIIIASNELDEQSILALKKAGAPIDIFGVGTRLITAFLEPALGGVYKLAAIKPAQEEQWQYRIKLSDDPQKTTLPGILQIRRYEHKGRYVGDVIFDETDKITEGDVFKGQPHILLKPIFEKGHLVYNFPSLESIQARCRVEIGKFSRGILNLTKAKTYAVALDKTLSARKEQLIKISKQ